MLPLAINLNGPYEQSHRYVRDRFLPKTCIYFVLWEGGRRLESPAIFEDDNPFFCHGVGAIYLCGHPFNDTAIIEWLPYDKVMLLS